MLKIAKWCSCIGMNKKKYRKWVMVNIKVICSMGCVMEEVVKSMKMVKYMKENGSKIKGMDMEL